MSEEVAYVVTSGDYSNYRINRVFSSRELARKYIEGRGPYSGDAEIEEWPIDGESRGDYRSPWDVTFLADRDPQWEVRSVSHVAKDHGGSDRHQFYASVWARDKQHALKIGSEIRAISIAHE